MRSSVSTPGFVGLLSSVCLLLGGCSEPAEQSIPTHAATGTVLLATGEPLAGGMIEFRCLDNAGVTTIGVIADDGTFTLTTMLDSARVDGAIAGEYRVTVTPPLGDTDDVQDVGATFSLPDTYEIQPDGENRFTISLADAV